MGTKAIGTSIAIEQPVQVFAEEHYTKICQLWTCSASPIHDPDGRIIVVLNMSGPYEKVHSHTKGMVVSAVKAIEYQLKLLENAEKSDDATVFVSDDEQYERRDFNHRSRWEDRKGEQPVKKAVPYTATATGRKQDRRYFQ